MIHLANDPETSDTLKFPLYRRCGVNSIPTRLGMLCITLVTRIKLLKLDDMFLAAK